MLEIRKTQQQPPKDEPAPGNKATLGDTLGIGRGREVVSTTTDPKETPLMSYVQF